LVSCLVLSDSTCEIELACQPVITTTTTTSTTNCNWVVTRWR